MMKIVFAFIGCLLFFLNCSERNIIRMDNKKTLLAVIPKPLEAKKIDKNFHLTQSTRIAISEKNDEVLKIAGDFAEKFNLVAEIGLNNDKNQIAFLLSENSEKYGEEGYSLNVSEDRIRVEAFHPRGLFYAVQTLYQLAKINNVNKFEGKIPCVRIFDKPEFGWRGDMLDVSRHFLPVSFIKKNLDYLARYKMNVFHWHLTDDQGWRIQVDGYPNLTKTGAWRVDRNDEEWWGRKAQQHGEEATYGGFYTKNEIREIVAYAKERYITIIPEIDMPGHSQAIVASYPEVSCDGGSYHVATGGVAKNNTVCPGKEESFKFIEEVLGEVLELFPGEYFHIGGDECDKSMWEKCDDCQARIKNEGLKDEHELQSYFIQRVEKTVNKLGKKLIGWDEILEGGLAGNAAVMSWRGEDGGIKAAEMNHYVVMSPNTYCYLDLKQGDAELEPKLGYSECKLSTCYSYNPLPEELSKDKLKYILGVQGNLWGESIQSEENANYMLFPRLQAIAEVGWTPARMRSWTDFVYRIESDMKWMHSQGIGFAKSIYNVAIDIVLLESKFGIRLSTEHGLLPIYYTLDGSMPTAESLLYKKPLDITETVMIKAATFREGKMLGKVKSINFQIHKAFGKPVKLAKKPSEKYNGIDNTSLTDLMRGSISIGDKQWMGYEDKHFEAVVDMGKITSIESVSLGCLEDQGSWIFLPNFVEVYISNDGVNYSKAERLKVDNSKINNESKVINLEIRIEKTKTRYIKISAENIGKCPDWHQGAGGKAWLFVDEIIVE